MKAARQQAIVDLLITHSILTTETLSKQLNVSRETIRRDLSELQAQGKVLRNHGRAKVIHQRSQDSGDPFHMRLKSHYAHKADIAREALAWIDEDGDRPRCQLHLLVSRPPAAGPPAARLYQQPAHLPGAGQTRPDHAHLLRRHSAAEIWLLREPGADFPAEIRWRSILFIFSCEGIDPQARCGTPMRSMPTSNRSCLSGRRSRCC